jgi:hypothetical protein
MQRFSWGTGIQKNAPYGTPKKFKKNWKRTNMVDDTFNDLRDVVVHRSGVIVVL